MGCAEERARSRNLTRMMRFLSSAHPMVLLQNYHIQIES